MKENLINGETKAYCVDVFSENTENWREIKLEYGTDQI